jgi:hypothetical protein
MSSRGTKPIQACHEAMIPMMQTGSDNILRAFYARACRHCLASVAAHVEHCWVRLIINVIGIGGFSDSLLLLTINQYAGPCCLVNERTVEEPMAAVRAPAAGRRLLPPVLLLLLRRRLLAFFAKER